MTSTEPIESASDFYHGFLEAHIGKDQTVTIKTLAGTDTTGHVERVGEGIVTLVARKKTRSDIHRWDIRIDHISLIYTVNEETD